MSCHSGCNCEGIKKRAEIRHIGQIQTHMKHEKARFPSSVENQGNDLLAAPTCWLRITIVHNVVITVKFLLPTAVYFINVPFVRFS